MQHNSKNNIAMAKTLIQFDNKIRVKFLVNEQKYFLFYGNSHIILDGKFGAQFDTQPQAEKVGKKLIHKGDNIYSSK